MSVNLRIITHYSPISLFITYKLRDIQKYYLILYKSNNIKKKTLVNN